VKKPAQRGAALVSFLREKHTELVLRYVFCYRICCCCDDLAPRRYQHLSPVVTSRMLAMWDVQTFAASCSFRQLLVGKCRDKNVFSLFCAFDLRLPRDTMCRYNAMASAAMREIQPSE
jgi:hypothetical protein